MFTFGVEHEVAFLLNGAGHFVDFVSTSFAEFDRIIIDLPLDRRCIGSFIVR